MLYFPTYFAWFLEYVINAFIFRLKYFLIIHKGFRVLNKQTSILVNFLFRRTVDLSSSVTSNSVKNFDKVHIKM